MANPKLTKRDSCQKVNPATLAGGRLTKCCSSQVQPTHFSYEGIDDQGNKVWSWGKTINY